MGSKSVPIPTSFPVTSPTTPSLPRLHLLDGPVPLFPSSPKPRPLRARLPNCQNPSPHIHSAPQQPPSSDLFVDSQEPISPQSPDLLGDAQEAISIFLQEHGLSVEEADLIALGCPKYAAMLVDGVRDLEECNGWSSAGGGGGERVFGELGFKEKVIYMARERADGGKVAFLESFGLSLSSSMNVARYLSGELLPGIVEKVKFMKEIFFHQNDDEGVIGKNARRMMMHLSINIDEDLQRTLSFFEKIAARRGGLNMLGSSDASLLYLVESFPRILLLTINSQLKPLAEYFESIGVPKEHMRIIFLLFPPVMILDLRGMREKVETFQKVGSLDKNLGKLLRKYPWILSTCIQDNYKEILSYFNLQKVPKDRVKKALARYPYLLGCSTSKLQVMVDQLWELGIKDQRLGKVIAKSPQLLLRKPRDFLQVVSLMEGVGFDRKNVGMILARCPEIFAANIERTLKKKLDFLDRIGISKAHVPRAIKKYPELLISDVDKTLLPRVNYLMRIGLSQREVAFMICGFSPLLGYSIDEVLRPKYEFLVNIMKKPVKDVVDYPRYFSYSLEKKIRPRFFVLKARNIECSLKDMLDKNDEEFAAKFMDAEGLLLPPSSPTQLQALCSV